MTFYLINYKLFNVCNQDKVSVMGFKKTLDNEYKERSKKF